MAVQWFPILDEALARHDAIGVADVVEQHLGRTPTRSELMSARRAAHRFVAGSDAQLALIPTVVESGTRTILVIARPGVDLDDVSRVRRIVAASRQPERAKVSTPRTQHDTSRGCSRRCRRLHGRLGSSRSGGSNRRTPGCSPTI